MALLHDTSSRERGVTVVPIVLSILFIFAYTLLFPRSLGKEFFFVPEKVQTVQPIDSPTLTPQGSFFRLGDWEGYWGPDGKLERVRAARPNLQVTPQKIAYYNPDTDQVVVEGVQGQLFSISGAQYPYWSSDRLFLFDENRMGISEVSETGKVVWSKIFPSLITAIDAKKNLLVVGTLDGKVQIFDKKEGALVGSFAPGGSRLPVVYNTAISPDEKRVLVLAGVDPKRFILLEKGGSDYRPVFHKPLEEKSRHPTALGFFGSGRYAYYEMGKGLSILDGQNTSDENPLTFDGNVVNLAWLSDQEFLVYLTQKASQAYFRVSALDGATILELPFEAKDVLLKRQGQKFVLGIDQNLLILELKQE